MNWSDTNNCEPYNIMRGQVKHDKGIMKRCNDSQNRKRNNEGQKERMNKKSLYRHFALCSLPILIEFFLFGAPSNPSTFIPVIVLLRFIPVGGGSL